MEGLGLQQSTDTSNGGLNLMQQAQQQYPVLKGLGLGYKYNPRKDSGYLEYWPGDEPGTSERPRPKEFAPGQAGIEVYDPKTRPIDILGDVVSHQLVGQDPMITGFYEQFQKSMTPEQLAQLRRQYTHAQQYEQEQRPYDQWAERAGIPGYFRGYPFQQWDNAKEMYTPEQIQMFDRMMNYLTTTP